jgi:ribosomal protein RSM22 (predicted rRNA methylase)
LKLPWRLARIEGLLAHFPDFSALLQECLVGVSRRELAGRAERLSAHYRAGGASAAVVRDHHDGLAYALVRMPATFAAVSRVMRMLAEDTDFDPKTMLDLACGPGTASFAAALQWPRLQERILVDQNGALLGVARTLNQASATGAVGAIRYLQQRLETTSQLPAADLVIMSYALVEMAPAQIPTLVGSLWQLSAGRLILVEPGTPLGFGRIRLARDVLIAAGARIHFPCPHEAPCPMQEPDWCHFAQRLPRSRDHLALKAANVPFEDEKYSYLVAGRERPTKAIEGRVLRVVKRDRASVHLELCTPTGLARRVVSRRAAGAEFGRWKKLVGGDGFVAGNGTPDG